MLCFSSSRSCLADMRRLKFRVRFLVVLLYWRVSTCSNIVHQATHLLTHICQQSTLILSSYSSFITMPAANAAALLYDRMDHGLRRAFLTCYKTYGKISTKKLISCFQDPAAIEAVRQVLLQGENSYDIPKPPSRIYKVTANENNEEDVVGGCPGWLENLPVGPGVSPCVHSTCLVFLEEETRTEGRVAPLVDSLGFFEELCYKAVGPSKFVSVNSIEARKIVAGVREQTIGEYVFVDHSD